MGWPTYPVDQRRVAKSSESDGWGSVGRPGGSEVSVSSKSEDVGKDDSWECSDGAAAVEYVAAAVSVRTVNSASGTSE